MAEQFHLKTAVPAAFIQLCFCQDTTCISIASVCIETIRLEKKNHWKSCDKMGYIIFLFIWLLSKRAWLIKANSRLKESEHYGNKISVIIKENSQYRTIWICYQAHKSSTWKKIREGKKWQESPPGRPDSFQVATVLKANQGLVALLSNCAMHRNSSLKQH